MLPEPAPAPDDVERGHPVPDLPTLIYDGDCAFCQRCADWIAAHLPVEVQVVPSQQADLAALGLSAQQASDAAWWIDSEGPQRGHRAVAAALRAAGGIWKPVGRGLTAPLISPVAGTV